MLATQQGEPREVLAAMAGTSAVATSGTIGRAMVEGVAVAVSEVQVVTVEQGDRVAMQAAAVYISRPAS
jgi:hypothetical protein